MLFLPTIFSASHQGLPPVEDKFGPLGKPAAVTLHHSAGPRAPRKEDCIRLNKVYDAGHRGKGWGGIGYHLIMDDHGRLYRARPARLKGAHVGLHNSNNYGLMVHGDYTKDRLNWRQRRTLRALYRGRVPGFEWMGQVDWFGHQEWPGHESNACPGSIMNFLRWLRRRPR